MTRTNTSDIFFTILLNLYFIYIYLSYIPICLSKKKLVAKIKKNLAKQKNKFI